jgi:hypothetical protein
MIGKLREPARQGCLEKSDVGGQFSVFSYQLSVFGQTK